MADIAMLVAEEYERRVNNLRKLAAEREMTIKQNNNAAPATATAAATTADVVNVSIVADGIKIRKFVKWVLEPKSQITLAAFDGFFSA
ncbi:hypothetical protein WN943_023778 [Citrus x changshan-huyou]|uniref:Uncharacterized protein n=1 Tax=Citrus sinensis TaxID=2711 RepID=A0A067DY35_CITSI|nr:hypothetical protein CISIN_1g034692mg [Citrus sinensis]